jgi:VWFA-related protein
MATRTGRRARKIVTVAFAAMFMPTVVGTQQPQVPGAFRSGTVMVPVDVRVLDRHGNPVTDLTAADFTILENDVRQEIGHFSVQAFTALTPEPGARPVLRQGPGLESSPLTHRTFLVVLGRGRLQGPSKGMDAVIDFVRTRLLPQDRAGVVAYWRTTDLITDRESVVHLLERYRDRHSSIETKIEHWRTDNLQFRSGNHKMPTTVRAEIDALFDSPGLPGLRDLPQNNGGTVGRAFDLQVALRPSVVLLLAGIEYLRHLEGEKHLIFVTEEGLLHAGRAGDHLATIAADARVAISVIQTAGVPLKWRPGNLASRGPWNSPRPPELVGRSFSELWAVADAQSLVERTGGIASFSQQAESTLDHLNRVTRFHYLLGYYPTNATWDGKYRAISVKVNRPDVFVMYRHGYYGHQGLVSYDRRDVMTDHRIAAAGSSRFEIRDIPVRISSSAVNHKRDASDVRVELSIDSSRVTFKYEEGWHTGCLDVAVFVGDGGQKLIGETWERIDLRLDDTAHARVLRDGIVHTTTVKITGRPLHVKAVVYDYEADRLGTAAKRLH